MDSEVKLKPLSDGASDCFGARAGGSILSVPVFKYALWSAGCQSLYRPDHPGHCGSAAGSQSGAITWNPGKVQECIKTVKEDVCQGEEKKSYRE